MEILPFEYYVIEYTDFKLRKSIIKQINAFREGFYWLIPFNEIQNFTPDDLDAIIRGNNEVNINDLKENISYLYPYSLKHPVIQLFFQVISKWNSDNLSKLFLFITGSPQFPVNGIKISPGGDQNRLCVAHTCFNQLDLPEYEDEVDMNNKLFLSIQECHFGLI